MRRVSSRQRLVSWDAFDAAAPEGDYNLSDADDVATASDNEDDVGYDTALEDNSCNDFIPTMSSSYDLTMVGRKRDRSARRSESKVTATTSPIKPVSSPTTIPALKLSSLAVPALIPSYSWEQQATSDPTSNFHHLTNSASTNTLSSYVTTSSTLLPTTPETQSNADSVLHLNELMKDVHVAIFAFLDLESLQAVMAVNHMYRRLVLSQDTQASLWDHHCQKAWRVMGPENEQVQESSLRYLDRFHIPTTLAAPHFTNLPLLLHMTPEHYPTSVDEDLVIARNARTERLQPLIRDHPILQRVRTQTGSLLSYRDSSGRRLVRYNGPVGAGDRCIRSDHPLPRPNKTNDDSTDQEQQKQPKSRFLVNLLRRGANKMVKSTSSSLSSSCSSSQLHSSPTWKPFVVPFMENSCTVNVTPRLISYYEVSILSNEKATDDDDDGDDDGLGPVLPAGQRSDCVAVGLATASFHVHTRMPGWDRQSFGYHGDDGGIFHSSGAMLKEFGSKFGAGDTVGCGIDYVTQGIFFTLNGRFLGYGWKGIDEELLQNDIYPVVGLDTNCPLHMNFGTDEPFQFDLGRFIMKHESIIAPQYSLDDKSDSAIGSSIDAPKMTREISMLSFPSTGSLASLASAASSPTGRRRFRRRGGRDRT